MVGKDFVVFQNEEVTTWIQLLQPRRGAPVLGLRQVREDEPGVQKVGRSGGQWQPGYIVAEEIGQGTAAAACAKNASDVSSPTSRCGRSRSARSRVVKPGPHPRSTAR